MGRYDYLNAVLLFALIVILMIAYAVRVLLMGRAKYERVERQGGSPLLGKTLLEMAYWGLQPLAKFLHFLRVTPNQLSFSSVILALLSGVCLFYGHFGFGAVFATLASLLDALDGMIARFRGIQSRVGELIDSTIDRYVEFIFLGSLTLYYREIPMIMGLCLLAILGSFMVSYSTAKAEALHITPPKQSLMRRPERAFYLILGAALCPVTIPVFEVYRSYPIALGHPMVIALGLVAVLSNLSAIERSIAIAKAVKKREKVQSQAQEDVQVAETAKIQTRSI